MNNLNLLISYIEENLKNTNGIILCIDGMASGGKSTLAKYLSEKFGGRVIHMDDFFLPVELRTKDRYETPGGNVHYERFIEQVLPNLNNDIVYQKFNCHLMDYDGNVVLPKTNLTIIEGSYSAHPTFGNYFDCLVYMDIDKNLQISRITNRDGIDQLNNFINKWLKYEQLYFDTYNIKEKAKFIFRNFEL